MEEVERESFAALRSRPPVAKVGAASFFVGTSSYEVSSVERDEEEYETPYSLIFISRKRLRCIVDVHTLLPVHPWHLGM